MEYTLTLKKAGRREGVYGFLKNNLNSFDTAAFDFKDVRRDGDAVHLDFSIDIDKLVYQLVLRGLNSDGSNPLIKQGVLIQVKQKIKRARSRGKFKSDDPKTPENEAWEGGKAPAKKKKAAPRKKKAVAKKAPAKKK